MTATATKNEVNEGNVSKFVSKNAEPKLTAEIEGLKEDLKVLKEDIASLTKMITQTSLDEVNKAKTNLTENGRELLDSTSEMTKKSIEKAESTVRENPFLYVASAFGIGVLASKLLSASNNK